MARLLDEQLKRLEDTTFGEVQVRLRYAAAAIRRGVSQLNHEEDEQLQRSGMLPYLQEAEAWINNPTPGIKWRDRITQCHNLVKKLSPRTNGERPEGVAVAAEAINYLLMGCGQADPFQTGRADLNEAQRHANLVVRWCRDISPQNLDAVIQEQYRLARQFWPNHSWM